MGENSIVEDGWATVFYYTNFPAFGRDFKKNITDFLDELSFAIELFCIIELPFIVQLSFTIELSPMKNEYANFPAFGRDFKKTSLFFLTSCPSLLSCPLLLSCLSLFSYPLLLSFLPWRIIMLTTRPSAGISKNINDLSWRAVLCYWAVLYYWAAFHCSAVLYYWAFSHEEWVC